MENRPSYRAVGSRSRHGKEESVSRNRCLCFWSPRRWSVGWLRLFGCGFTPMPRHFGSENLCFRRRGNDHVSRPFLVCFENGGRDLVCFRVSALTHDCFFSLSLSLFFCCEMDIGHCGAFVRIFVSQCWLKLPWLTLFYLRRRGFLYGEEPTI